MAFEETSSWQNALHLFFCYGRGSLGHLESKLSRVVVHAAAEHEWEDVPDAIAVEYLFAGRRTESAIGQRRTHHRQRVGVHLHRTRLKMFWRWCAFSSTFRFVNHMLERTCCPKYDKFLTEKVLQNDWQLEGFLKVIIELQSYANALGFIRWYSQLKNVSYIVESFIFTLRKYYQIKNLNYLTKTSATWKQN